MTTLELVLLHSIALVFGFAVGWFSDDFVKVIKKYFKAL